MSESVIHVRRASATRERRAGTRGANGEDTGSGGKTNAHGEKVRGEIIAHAEKVRAEVKRH
jgi:hypothetical protein